MKFSVFPTVVFLNLPDLTPKWLTFNVTEIIQLFAPILFISWLWTHWLCPGLLQGHPPSVLTLSPSHCSFSGGICVLLFVEFHFSFAEVYPYIPFSERVHGI